MGTRVDEPVREQTVEIAVRPERCLDWACEGFGLDVARRDRDTNELNCPYGRVRCTQP